MVHGSSTARFRAPYDRLVFSPADIWRGSLTYRCLLASSALVPNLPRDEKCFTALSLRRITAVALATGLCDFSLGTGVIRKINASNARV